MSEIINSYSEDNTYKLIPMDRGLFYKEQVEVFKKDWTPNKYVEVINVLLFNESGEVILQKRSSHKWHNANLIDKTVWWHIVNWDSPDFTVMVETVQELQVPSIVLRTKDDFDKTHDLLSSYTQSTSIIRYIDSQNTVIPKIIKGEKINIWNKTHLYFWIYGWSVKNVDREAKWILFYDYDELLQEMKDFPDIFTNDLKYYLDKYDSQIREFIKNIKK